VTTIVIGGHSRKVGKTAVVAGVIRAFSQYTWTAAKISSHWHEDPPAGAACIILEENVPGEQSDSARFLAAGAARAFWIRIREDRLLESMPELLPVLQSGPFVIIESNCILRLIRPELYVLILNSRVDEFKPSARETLPRADAILLISSGPASPAWQRFVLEDAAGIPLFTSKDPNLLPPEFLAFVQTRLPAAQP
jgi:hypothetical protein